MLARAKMFCIYTFTAAAAALLGGFATENLPTHDADESLAAADETPVTTPDGWVVREMQAMVVPADAPIGLRFEDGEVPPPRVADSQAPARPDAHPRVGPQRDGPSLSPPNESLDGPPVRRGV